MFSPCWVLFSSSLSVKALKSAKHPPLWQLSLWGLLWGPSLRHLVTLTIPEAISGCQTPPGHPGCLGVPGTYQRWVVLFHTILCSCSVSLCTTPLQLSTN